ncbi:glycosyl transferase family 2 [Intestinibaculum porci]|uniref:Glycosyl transferase family 2 n=1 Tax=Intestinibaculum porci TaxID=2487118 RepID=A0A3G9JX69_9FIRM|nr:glycosyltransferase family 2 protein [Intestinibaculum porci]BBH27394.1 glycosyl transferase family 2 [Intestinibaculum porci]
MNDNPLISVIVPIYNVEQYLKRCVESIRRQTYSNLEIILVDDGSPDNCGKICDDYKKEDNRIKVIHKKNGGLSDARNAGIEIAQGEYITCIDSDDFISQFFIENLWIAIQKSGCEIATSWFADYYEGDNIPEAKKVDMKDIAVLSREEFYKKLLYQDGVEVSAWGKLYKTDLFEGVKYPVGKLYEDIPTTYLLVEKTNKVAVIPNIDYFYFQRSTSIAQTTFSMRKMDAINHMDDFKNYIIHNYPSLKRAAECRYFSTVCNILFQISSPEFKQTKENLWQEIKKYRYSVMTNRFGRKKARIAAFLSYGGYKFLHMIYVRTQKGTS